MFRRRDEEENFITNTNVTGFGGYPIKKTNSPFEEETTPMKQTHTEQQAPAATKEEPLFATTAAAQATKSAPAYNPAASAAPAQETAKPAPTTYKLTSSGAFTTSNTPTPAPSSSSPTLSPRFDAVEAERRLTVGYGITLEGKVSNCDKLIIYGAVNAELNSVKALHISESGKFSGSASIEQAEISGIFEGELRVAKNIIINSTGRVSGKITYGSIEIKPGGKFTGEIIEDIQPGFDLNQSEKAA